MGESAIRQMTGVMTSLQFYPLLRIQELLEQRGSHGTHLNGKGWNGKKLGRDEEWTPLDRNNTVECHKQWPIIDVVSLQNQNKHERYKHLLVSEATYVYASLHLQLTPTITAADTTDWLSWKSYVSPKSIWLFCSFPLQIHLGDSSCGSVWNHCSWVLHANTLLDLHSIRWESSEGEYQDGSDSTVFAFLFFQRNWHRCWTIGLGQGNCG